jgi:iron complex outermembrane receptor protein
VTGVYYFRESNRSSFADVFTSTATRVPALLADRQLRNATEAWAVYFQGDLKLTDALAVTVGARYTDEDKDVAITDLRDPRVQPIAGGVSQRLETANIAAFGIPTQQGAEQWTPRLALNFDASDDLLLFATATRGFRSGGWNARSTSANLFLPFGPEKVWSYELGAKSEWLDRRLRANATLFAVDVEDFQIPAAFVNPLTGALTFISGNFAGLRNRGVELELQAVPLPELNVYANVGYQDASYVDVNAATLAQQGRCVAYLQAGGAPLPGVQGCGQGLVTVAGGIAKPVRTPKLTASLGGSYAISLGASGLRLTPSINVSYSADQETGATNLSFYEENGVPNAIGNGTFVTGSFSGARWLTDAALGLEPEDGHWRVSAECTNCFDRDYVQSTTSNYSYLNSPGRWMLRFRYRFGGEGP